MVTVVVYHSGRISAKVKGIMGRVQERPDISFQLSSPTVVVWKALLPTSINDNIYRVLSIREVHSSLGVKFFLEVGHVCM